MRYVICHKCGDPVGGRIPSGNEERILECVHCHEKFEFIEGEISAGIVTYDEATKRWKVGRLG